MFPGFGCPGAGGAGGAFLVCAAQSTPIRTDVPRSALARYILRCERPKQITPASPSSFAARGDSGANGFETAHLLRDRNLSRQPFDGRSSEKAVHAAGVVDNPCSVVRFRDWSAVTKYEHVRAFALTSIDNAIHEH